MPTRRACVSAERELTRALGASCNTPVGAHARAGEDGRVELRAWVGLPDGSAWVATGCTAVAEGLGRQSPSGCSPQAPASCCARPSGDGRRVTVYLVGAGPGDPGLLTARALELIAAADVIVYDRLIPDSALDGARRDAELLYAGKEGGGPSMPQSEIERLLVEHGRGGHGRSCGSRAAIRSCSAAAARRPRRCATPGSRSRSSPA